MIDTILPEIKHQSQHRPHGVYLMDGWLGFYDILRGYI